MNLNNNSKVLPQAIELEEAVLGAIMLEPTAMNEIIGIFNPKVFYKDPHIHIATAILEIRKEGVHPDILLVTERLKRMKKLEEAGGAYYVTQLTSRVASSANITYHYHILIQKYVQREFIYLMNEKIKDAFDDGCDIFDLLEGAEKDLRKINPVNKETWEKNSTEIVEEIEKTLLDTISSSGIYMFYETGWPTFDKYVGTSRNKILTIGGASGHGKSRFVSSWMFSLLNRYPNDISVFWCSFEDSAEDILLFYLSQKFGIKAKDIKKRNFDKALIPDMKEAAKKFKSFDLHFVDRSSKIAFLKNRFELFCDKRTTRFPIFILDNLLSVKDKNDFKGNDNAMEDYVMNELLSLRQNTHALIILVHHYGKQIFKDRIDSGYRPLIDDLKGSERIPAVSNQVLLINNPKVFKDLLAQYHGDEKEVLKSLFIIDPGKIRDDSNSDEEALIHFWCNMDYLKFKEVKRNA